MSKEMRFDDQVVVVTGGGRGIGRAHCLLLAERGAKVVVNDLGGDGAGQGSSSGPADEVTAEIRAANGQAEASHHSVSTEEGAEGIIDTALRAFGRVDAVIHNAGIAALNSFLDEGHDLYRRTRATHLDGGYNICRAAWPHMKARQYGRIVMTGSTSGMYGHHENIAYSGAKAGLMGLTRALAIVGEPDGIKINLLSVGAYTRLTNEIFRNAPSTPEVLAMKDFFNRHMKPSMPSPVAAFLVHPDCTSNGELWEATGGTVRQFAMMMTQGYINLDLTIEDVRDNLDKIRDRTNAIEFTTVGEYSEDMISRIRVAAGEADANSATSGTVPTDVLK